MAAAMDTTTGAGVPKHRACDECQKEGRKLACTKEADGCGRCKRERLVCHYSPQKPMGRPRKRPHVDAAEDDEPAGAVTAVADSDSAEMDIDMSFLDETLDNIGFLDLLGPEFAAQVQDLGPRSPERTPKSLPRFRGLWRSDLGDIDFDPASSPADGVCASTEASAPEQAPSLSSRSASTPETRTPSLPLAKYENKVCGCLASLYLALDSLQQLPKQVGPAMRVTRNAAKAAHDTVFCPSCSPPDPPHALVRPPIQSFQTLMMLGALLPTIANAYDRILVMVDEECARADRERRHIAFTLGDYGGMWGRMGDYESMCGETMGLNGNALEPSLWRRTARALLRIDVYGINPSGEEARLGPCGAFVQVGLKDIILLLEDRSKFRHDSMDAAIAAGLIDNPELYGHALLPPGQKHTCQQVLEIAKRSIDHLVIA